MLSSVLPALVAGLILFPSLISAKSIISTFSDANCQASIESLDGPNGYPNGTCTDFRRSGTYGSFQVVGLDAGCSVTIYPDDGSGVVCSGTPQLATVAACYNSSFAFYSIDMCEPSGAGNTNIPTLAGAAALTSPATLSSASTSDTTVSNTAASTATSTSPSSEPSQSSSTGAIVGGAVGGVLGVALIIGAVVLLIFRERRKKKAVGVEAGGQAISEVHGNSTAAPVHEKMGSPPVYEKMGTVPDLPPVELPAGQPVDAHTGAGAQAPPRHY